ncbi:MAG: hypothetical protein JW809_14885 [Pirellulales bacterium]|nr:hypothetical protein [Pirellulales bacterium]
MTRDDRGLVFKNGTATLLARVVGEDAAPIGQADIDSIVYSIYQLDAADADCRLAIAGHADVPLAVEDVIFDTLQTDARWTADAIGYNFAHTIDVATAPAFAIAGRDYLVEYRLAPVAGQLILVRFRLHAI